MTDGSEMNEDRSKDSMTRTPRSQVEDMAIRLKHLENDYSLAKEEYEEAILKYMEILEEWRKKNHELEMLKTHLEQRVQERTVQLENSNRALSEEFRKHQRMEEELVRTRKLESIGVLAGGIAHDFNNLLAIVMGTITLAKISAEEDDQIFEELSRAETACIQARELTSRLITFSEGGGPLKKIHLLDRLLKESAGIALSGSRIRCTFELPENLWAVLIDEGQMQQVVLHLVRNAREAMPDGGAVNISAENVRISAGENPALKAGVYVKWSVKDQGRGIPEENLTRIFDPYFTTKPLSNIKGMGLGLAICHSIIKKHEGLISCRTEIGKGTVFTVYLPASPEEKVLSHEEVLSAPEGAQGRILVMDDEEMVRQVMGQILTYLGYEVVVAEDGDAAIARYREARDVARPFDLVILDLTVRGGMGGKQAIRKMRELAPDIRAIIATGYSNDPVVQSFRNYGFVGAITKPFTLMSLRSVVHDALARGCGN